MNKQEAIGRLEAISELINRNLDKTTPLLLLQVKAIAEGSEEELNQGTILKKKPKENKIIMSCDASIKVNPGGPSAVGAVVEFPNGEKLELSQGSNSTTNNQAEYDAIYFGLTTLMNLHNNPGVPIEIRSDSQLVIRQLSGDMKCKDEKLQKKRDIIRELVEAIPVPVKYVWRPRNSTAELKLANYLAQDLLGVPRH